MSLPRDIAALIAETRACAAAAREGRQLRALDVWLDGVADALVELRRLTTRLHRRAQRAESIVARARLVEDRPQGPQGRTFGRALANYAAAIFERERDEARRRLAEEARKVGRLRAEVARLRAGSDGGEER